MTVVTPRFDVDSDWRQLSASPPLTTTNMHGENFETIESRLYRGFNTQFRRDGVWPMNRLR